MELLETMLMAPIKQRFSIAQWLRVDHALGSLGFKSQLSCDEPTCCLRQVSHTTSEPVHISTCTHESHQCFPLALVGCASWDSVLFSHSFNKYFLEWCQVKPQGIGTDTKNQHNVLRLACHSLHLLKLPKGFHRQGFPK